MILTKMFAVILPILLLAINQGECFMEAIAIVKLSGTETSVGTIIFTQNDATSPVLVTGNLTIASANNTSHGFHVHTEPVTENFPNCVDAQGHFNPYNMSHGPRETDIYNRHVGDLGNLTADANGFINVDISDDIIQLYNATQSIINRTVIIHAVHDDGGSTNTGTSSVTGNAGARIACGLIKLMTDSATTEMTTSPIETTISETTSSAIITPPTTIFPTTTRTTTLATATPPTTTLATTTPQTTTLATTITNATTLTTTITNATTLTTTITNATMATPTTSRPSSAGFNSPFVVPNLFLALILTFMIAF